MVRALETGSISRLLLAGLAKEAALAAAMVGGGVAVVVGSVFAEADAERVLERVATMLTGRGVLVSI